MCIKRLLDKDGVNVSKCLPIMAVREVTRVDQLLTTVDFHTTINETIQMELSTIMLYQQFKKNVVYKEKSNMRINAKWSDNESKLVKEYFHEYISDLSNKGQLPQKEEITRFLK